MSGQIEAIRSGMISGPPDPEFAKKNGSGWLLQQAMRLLSFGIRRKSKRRGVEYSFLFMTANGGQLGQVTSLIEANAIRPVVDRVFPFEKTNEAMSKRAVRRAKSLSLYRDGRGVSALGQQRPFAL